MTAATPPTAKLHFHISQKQVSNCNIWQGLPKSFDIVSHRSLTRFFTGMASKSYSQNFAIRSGQKVMYSGCKFAKYPKSLFPAKIIWKDYLQFTFVSLITTSHPLFKWEMKACQGRPSRWRWWGRWPWWRWGSGCRCLWAAYPHVIALDIIFKRNYWSLWHLPKASYLLQSG